MAYNPFESGTRDNSLFPNVTSRRRKLTQDIHRMTGVLGMTDEDYRAYLGQWGVRSSRDMTDAQLIECAKRLHDITDPQVNPSSGPVCDRDELIKWRRRVYAVIGSWLAEMGYRSDSDAIRTVAIRAAGPDVTFFNRIPLSTLKQIYASWCKKQKTARATSETLSTDTDRLLSGIGMN